MKNLIAVGTVSQHKLTAVKNAVRQAGLEEFLAITGVKTSSGTAEQPMGFDEIRSGAVNRALGALQAIFGENDPVPRYGLGIENGLVDIGAAGPYIDLAVIVLIERGQSPSEMLSKAVFTTSAGVPCHPKYVRRSFDADRGKTVGDFIAEDTGCDGTDWHSYITSERLPRSAILEQAVLGALSVKFPKP